MLKNTGVLNPEDGGLWILGRKRSLESIGWGVGNRLGWHDFSPFLQVWVQGLEFGVDGLKARFLIFFFSQRKKNLGVAFSPAASPDLALSALPLPVFPPTLLEKRTSKQAGRRWGLGCGLSFCRLSPSLYTLAFLGRRDARPGTPSLLEIMKIYASACKHTFKSWRFPSTLVYLNSRASWISSLPVVCLCHRQAANGRASRRCALYISLLPPPHTEGSVRPLNTNHPAPHHLFPPPALEAGRELQHCEGAGVERVGTWGWGAEAEPRGPGRWNRSP